VSVNPDYLQLFRALRPETSLILGALVALGLDLSVARRHPLEERLRLALDLASVSVSVVRSMSTVNQKDGVPLVILFNLQHYCVVVDGSAAKLDRDSYVEVKLHLVEGVPHIASLEAKRGA